MLFKIKALSINKYFWQIVGLFLGWRVLLIVCTMVAVNFVPLGFKDRFLGGGPINYQTAPEFFSWVNFDGEHYLSIAIFGYKNLEQAFFPLYPKLISLSSSFLHLDWFSFLFSTAFIGLIISNLSFLLALILLWETVRIDYCAKIAFLTILTLLVFPTSFYFGALYSESLFLLLTVGAFYFSRKQKWYLVGILGALASATRIFGILLFPTFLIEAWQQKTALKKSFWVFLIPLGLLAYMVYEWWTIGDPLAFYNLQKIVGEQHQSGIIFLPQIWFRYVKMFLTVDKLNPIYQTLILEFLTGLLFFFLPIYGYFKKLRLSYLFFALIGFLLATIQGSFSSLPRYVLILFPSFIAFAIWLENKPKLITFSILLISLCWLMVETMLFLRGYWIA